MQEQKDIIIHHKGRVLVIPGWVYQMMNKCEKEIIQMALKDKTILDEPVSVTSDE